MSETGVQDEETGLRQIVAPGVSLAPPPRWVDLAPLEKPAEADPNFVVSGCSVLLEDAQVDLSGPAPAHFWRRAEMVVAPSGASHVGRFDAEFDPAQERIEIHFILVHRGGETIARGAASDFEVLRRERNLEMRHFDGRLTAHLEIPDVRVGDIVETAWTVYGEPAAVAGRYTGWTRFEWSPAGMVETRHRVLAPAARPIAAKGFGGDVPACVETASGDLIDRRWVARGRQGKQLESLAPDWIVQLAHLQLSEWRDWTEVAARFWPFYEEDGPLPAELEAKLAELAGVARLEDRAAALLRFVQASIRYLAISIGAGGLIPRTVAAIWETRYGDCKDVTKLYVLLARRLDLEACPALVSTTAGEGVNALLPTPRAFDHCLVRLRLPGKTYWLDATSAPQPSPLETLSQAHFGWALPLTPQSAGLEHMGPEPYLTLCDSHETVDIPDRPEKPIRYSWTIVSRGWRAEWVRAQIAQQGEVGYFKQREDNMRHVWPGARQMSRAVRDDAAANAITVEVAYDVVDAWKDHAPGKVRFTTLDTIIANSLAALDAGPRTLPIFMGRVGRLARRVEITTPVPWGANGWTRSVAHQAASLNFTFAATGPLACVLEQEFKIRETTMAPDSAERYRELAGELRATDVNFVGTVAKGKFVRPATPRKRGRPYLVWIWIGFMALGLIARLIGTPPH